MAFSVARYAYRVRPLGSRLPFGSRSRESGLSKQVGLGEVASYFSQQDLGHCHTVRSPFGTYMDIEVEYHCGP